MAPRQSCSSLLDDCVAVRPGEGEGPHVRQAARAESPRTRELALQVRREPLDHLRAPALLVPAIRERPTDRPVQAEQLGVGFADARTTLRGEICQGEMARAAARATRRGGPVPRPPLRPRKRLSRGIPALGPFSTATGKKSAVLEAIAEEVP